MRKPQFFGNNSEDLSLQISSALSDLKMSYGEVIPLITTEGESEHSLVSWSLEGMAQVQYTDNSNIPAIEINGTLRQVELHSVNVQLEQTAIDELRKRQKKELSLSEESIKLALGLGIEVRCREILFKGITNQVSGLFSLKEAQTLKKKLTTKQELRNALIDGRTAILKKGAKTGGMITALVPMSYESLLKEPISETVIDSTEDYLARQYNFVFDYSFDYEKIVLFQDTFSNLYFQRDSEIQIEKRLAYENRAERWFATLTLAGLVVKNEEQICYLIAKG